MYFFPGKIPFLKPTCRMLLFILSFSGPGGATPCHKLNKVGREMKLLNVEILNPLSFQTEHIHEDSIRIIGNTVRI